jgi:hypothetical protein
MLTINYIDLLNVKIGFVELISQQILIGKKRLYKYNNVSKIAQFTIEIYLFCKNL